MMGKLLLIGTPIGNLEDITIRALNSLQSCHVIYAEDTRHSIRLLTHFDIKKPLYSYHEHNKETAGKEIVEKVRQGQLVGLVTDAGMPGISDPGEDLVKLFIESEMPFEIIPGVSAFSMAVVGSGLPTTQFIFEGFLSRDKKQRKKHIEALKTDHRTLILYESPHRLKETLKLLLEGLGDRRAVVARELTKKFETFNRGMLSELLTYYSAETPRGEIVLILEGGRETSEASVPNYLNLTIPERYEMLLEAGSDRKDAMKIISVERNIKKSDVYAILNK